MRSEQEIELQVKRIMGKWLDEPVFSNIKCIEAAYLFFWRWYYKCTSGVYYKCKYACQRVFRGYDDLDKWNAAWYIARKAVPVLTAMRNSFHGTSLKWHREDRHGVIELLTADEVYAGCKEPTYTGPAAFTESEWCAILDDIIFAFQWQISSDDYNKPMTDAQMKQGAARQKRGLQFFGIYYNSLWD